MSPFVKKLVIIGIVGIVAWYIFTQPTSAGQSVQSILGGLRDAAEAVITFLKSVFKG